MHSEILSFLPASHPWRENLLWFDSIESTNTLAKKMAKEGAPHGTVLIANHQTGGRGRMGRSFHSPRSMGIYMSVILRYRKKPEQLMHLTCAAAVAMCDAVASATGVQPQIKWINDLVVSKKKLAGILTELVLLPEETCAVIGIGINCSQQAEDLDPQIRDMATSLQLCAGKPVDRAKVAAAMIEGFCAMDAQLFSRKEAVMESYRKNCLTLKQDVLLVRGDSVKNAYALDICTDGALLVRYPDGNTAQIQSGEASVRGMYGYLS